MSEPELFYYFTSTKYALEAVKNRRLKVAELDKTNDPYEFMAIRPPAMTMEDYQTTIRDDFSESIKMICVSSTYKNPSLWGNYADRGKGICLGFETNLYKNNDKLMFKMKYSKERIDMKKFEYIDDNGERNFDREKMRSDMQRYKSHHWKHEEEWRIWAHENSLQLDPITGLYFEKFEDSELKLRKILVGFRCKKEENLERRFRALTDKYPDPPEIFRTRLSSSAFEIEVDKDRKE